MKLPYHLGKLAGLVQSFYIPTGYSSLSVSRNRQLRCQLPVGVVDIRHLSSQLTCIISVTTNDCFSGVGFGNNNVFTG